MTETKGPVRGLSCVRVTGGERTPAAMQACLRRSHVLREHEWIASSARHANGQTSAERTPASLMPASMSAEGAALNDKQQLSSAADGGERDARGDAGVRSPPVSAADRRDGEHRGWQSFCPAAASRTARPPRGVVVAASFPQMNRRRVRPGVAQPEPGCAIDHRLDEQPRKRSHHASGRRRPRPHHAWRGPWSSRRGIRDA